MPHIALIAKLKRFGKKDNSLHWFSNYMYLNNRTQTLRIGNTLSNHLTIQCGVHQTSEEKPMSFLSSRNVLEMTYLATGTFIVTLSYTTLTLITITQETAKVVKIIVNCECIAVDWCRNSGMLTNPDLFAVSKI